MSLVEAARHVLAEKDLPEDVLLDVLTCVELLCSFCHVEGVRRPTLGHRHRDGISVILHFYFCEECGHTWVREAKGLHQVLDED